MRETSKFAWDISPQLAVHLAARYRMYSTVRSTLQELVRAYAECVSHIPEALPLFLGDTSVSYEYFDVGRSG